MLNESFFYSLLTKEGYARFLEDIARGRYPVPEREEWVSWYGGDQEALAARLRAVGELLFGKKTTVLYPVEMVVVPRFPFSKAPMVSWGPLQTMSVTDPEVVKLKRWCSELGNLINVGFLLRNFVLIDIDGKPENVRKLVDVETRRGFHILRYVPGYRAVLFKYRRNNSSGYKIRIMCSGVAIDLISSSLHLGSFPLQSRYLEFNGKLNVRVYKILSRDADIAFRSADLSTLTANPSDVLELIRDVLKELGCQEECNYIEIVPHEKEEIIPSERGGAGTPKTVSRFNRAPMMSVGLLSFKRFKELLAPYADRLPVCFREALFGNIEKGHRWFHLRLLIAILPNFVFIDRKELEDIVMDFASRTNSKRADVTKWFYDFRYFSGLAEVDENKVYVPSKLGVPAEAWTDFYGLGYCDACPYKDDCLSRSTASRRKMIVSIIERILEEALGGET